MDNYPVTFDVVRPARFDRAQVVIRLLICAVLGMIGVNFPWFFVLLYFALPAVAAGLISTRGPDRYLAETAPEIAKMLRWLGGLLAYMSFVTDRLPAGETPPVSLQVEIGGRPTLQSALWRLLSSLPEAIVLSLLGMVEGIVWVIAFVFVLVSETYPEGLWRFQRGLLGWQLRLLAYHASLVEPLPPFGFAEPRSSM